MDASLFTSGLACTPVERGALRIGLLLDTPLLARCFVEVLDHIQQSNFANLELVVFNAAAGKKPPAPLRKSRASKIVHLLRDKALRERLLFLLYQRWDQRHVDPHTDPLQLIDCSQRLSQIESLSVDPITKRFVHRFPADAIERIRAKQLDVLIRFGFNILRGDILTAAKYGIWSYHHGDNDFYRGGPPYMWELIEDNRLSGAILQVLTEELDAGKVLYKGLFSTDPGISLALNRIAPYWGSGTFMIQKLQELYCYGWQSLERNLVPPAPYRGKKKIYTQPVNREMISWLAPVLSRKVFRRFTRKPSLPHWRLAARQGAKSIADSTATPDLNGFQWLESPKGRFYADPFLIEHEGQRFVFFEDYDYGTRRGSISCAEVKQGSLGPAIPVLNCPYHLSYPCLFHHGGTLYMIPESGSNGTVELYACEKFPDVWRFERVLFKGRALDTTVWATQDVLWFFVTLQEPRGLATQLWLFYSDSPYGEWVRHPANPISTDVRDSRGGGAIFRHNGKLFRPSQDCSQNYGRSFALNEITALDETVYREKQSVAVEPVWAKNLIGTHTYARCGDLEIIDGCALVPTTSVIDRRRGVNQLAVSVTALPKDRPAQSN